LKFELSVPATLSNFGPGFDTLGMALNRYLKIKFEADESIKSNELIIEEGEYSHNVPAAEINMIYKAAEKYCKRNFMLKMKNDIPLKRGLGSSSAANAVTFVLKELLTHEELLKNDSHSLIETIRPRIYNDAIKSEGHPDNITPCLFGGFVTARIANGEGSFLNLPFPESLKLHVLIPDIEVETKLAREILPKSYSLKDVTSNLQNLSFMMAEFCLNSKIPEKLPIFMNLKNLLADRVHQDYRLELCRPCGEVIKMLNNSEKIYGTFLSGSGTTICAVAPEDAESEIKKALHLFEAQNIGVKYYIHNIEYSGLKIKIL